LRHRIEVGPAQAGDRLDRVIAASFPDVSRALGQKLIAEGRVTLAGKLGRASERVRSGDVVNIDLVLPPSLSAVPEDIDLEVVYEDESIAVIDKPAGLVVHPAPGHTSGTLVNGLVRRYPWIAESQALRPGLVHRLDKDTSGLMVVALNPAAHNSLVQQIKQRTMRREYVALTSGQVRRGRLLIDVPIGRDPASRIRMAAGPNTIRPRPARTHIRVSEYLAEFSLVHITLDTGRTHQVRVHMAYIGHPVAGDSMYGGVDVAGLDRQFLHAAALQLISPVTGEMMRFHSSLPSDLREVLTGLEEDRGTADV
jgi:23S rRNA pseudouridine1911/1915/1917 synthase